MRCIAYGLGLALLVQGAAWAQSTPGAAPPPAVQRAGEVEYRAAAPARRSGRR